MKKYSLKQTWEYCLAMWKYVAENWDGDSSQICYLKYRWLELYGFDKRGIECACFFCTYQATHKKQFVKDTGSNCPVCPGSEVAPKFDCYKSEWDTDADKFYRTLKRMYSKAKKLHGWK